MSIKQFSIGTVVSAILLFVWSGLTQVLPWGVPTAQVIVSQSAQQTDTFMAPNTISLPANALTTERFDSDLVDRVSTLTTDRTFSWIVSKPLAYYQPTDYLVREFLTQLLTAATLTAILMMARALPMGQKLALIALMGLAAALASYGQLFNWWGLPFGYTLGVSVNLVVSWVLAGAVVSRFVVK